MDIPSSIPTVEIPDLQPGYHKAQRNFVIWFVPTMLVVTVLCSLSMYFSTLTTPHFVYTLPVAVGSVAGIMVALSTCWTYIQQRYILDETWKEHIEDRKTARAMATDSVRLSFQLTQIGNLNTGQQAIFQQTGSEDPVVRKGGNIIRDFWSQKFGGDAEPMQLPDPSKTPFVMDWADVDELVDLMLSYGASRRDTAGMPLPSGKAVYSQIWTAVTTAMNTSGVAIVRSRAPTRLTMQDPAQIKQVLRTHFPKGIRVDPEGVKLAAASGKSRAKKTPPATPPQEIVDGQVVKT